MRPVLPLLILFCSAINLSSAAESPPADTRFIEKADVQGFVEMMVGEHGFDRQELTELFGSIGPVQSVIDRISRPAERTLKWFEYRRIFLSDKRIAAGRQFALDHAALLESAESQFGVPAEIIVAIIGVETFYGRITGKDPALASIATLAFDYPRRATFFRRELKEFLLLARDESLDVATIKGSYAGAMGMPQFISSSYRAYAIDFDKDGRRDLWSSTADVIGSVANYFVAHGWRPGEPVAERAYPDSVAYRRLLKSKRKPQLTKDDLASVGLKPRESGSGKMTLMELRQKKIVELWIGHHNFYVITEYNHSKLYAMAVLDLAVEIRRALAKNP